MNSANKDAEALVRRLPREQMFNSVDFGLYLYVGWGNKNQRFAHANIIAPGSGRDKDYASSTSGVTSRPRPSTSTSTTSPPLSQTGSFMPAMTPAGVPVMKMSPGTRVK